MDIRMIGFDMDGTLLGANGEFPQINCRALQECERRGIQLVFCSGRNFETLRTFAHRVGVNPLLASVNGARIDASVDGPTLLERTYDAAHSKVVYDALIEAKVYFIAFTRGHSYMCHPEYRLARQGHHPNSTVIDDGSGYVYHQVVDDERTRLEGTVGTYKYVAHGKEDGDPRFDLIRERIAPLNMSISSSWTDNIEIMMPGVDKGSAMRFLAERQGFTPDQVMVFGDHLNDVPMLEYAGWPVVMENGAPEAKALARIIAPRHDEGGVGQVIEKYILGA